MKTSFRYIHAMLLSMWFCKAIANPYGDEQRVGTLFGFTGGMAITSNPSSLQATTGKANYVDGMGGLILMRQRQVTDGFTFEWAMSSIVSSVKPLGKADNQTKFKWLIPMDFRFFLGKPRISNYIGLGIQYNSVWTVTRFEQSNSQTYYYYDPWWGYYYTDTYDYGTETKRELDAGLRQFSSNISTGFKIGLGEVDDESNTCPCNIILGSKIHLPIINSSEHHENETSSIDLSKDKICVALTAGLGLGGRWGMFMINYEYPIGGNNEYKITSGGSANFFNTHSQSISVNLLFNMGGGDR